MSHWERKITGEACQVAGGKDTSACTFTGKRCPGDIFAILLPVDHGISDICYYDGTNMPKKDDQGL